MIISSENKTKLYLIQALALAQARRGFCAPNPAVGAVVEKKGGIVGQGGHKVVGAPHAEVVALREAGTKAKGATLYVTLEPCCHQGRTPPCTDLIIECGIANVIYAFADPNPKVSGKGASQLRAAGIPCEQVVLPEVDYFYRSYAYWTRHRLPWVTLKLASSLDGKIAGAGGRPLALTGEALRRYTHAQRQCADAILTTVRTVVADDPALNVRLDGTRIAKPVYVLDRQLRFPVSAQLCKTASPLVLLCSETAQSARGVLFAGRGIKTVVLPESEAGLDLKAVCAYLGEQGVHDVWVEAGGRCAARFLELSLVQRCLIYLAPTVLGEAAYSGFNRMKAGSFKQFGAARWRPFGADVVCEMEVER